MPLFSGKPADRPIDFRRIPPPPGGSFLDPDDSAPPPSIRPRKPVGVRFDAELDICELDDRDRPGPAWSARGRELSRSHLIIRSRRMCYPGRRVLAAVHLVDDQPVPLFGKVVSCEYDGDGLYRVDLELLKLPERPEIADWLSRQKHRPS